MVAQGAVLKVWFKVWRRVGPGNYETRHASKQDASVIHGSPSKHEAKCGTRQEQSWVWWACQGGTGARQRILSSKRHAQQQAGFQRPNGAGSHRVHAGGLAPETAAAASRSPWQPCALGRLQLTAWWRERAPRVPRPPARPWSCRPGPGRWWWLQGARCWRRGPSQRGAGPRGRSPCGP